MGTTYKTIDIIKQHRKASVAALDERKNYLKMRKAITEALKEEPKSIPQIAEASKISLSDITYYLMAMLKFGEVAVNGIDDMDEYYFYELKKQ
jgi:predicted Rossmann fold nucleotide-binding protein DprA/Smf involved in DNA uptake